MDFIYEIHTKGISITEPLSGIAFLKYQSAKLIDGCAKLYRVYAGIDYDPVLHGTVIYNESDGGWDHFPMRFPRPCSPDSKPSCPYLKSIKGGASEYYAGNAKQDRMDLASEVEQGIISLDQAVATVTEWFTESEKAIEVSPDA